MTVLSGAHRCWRLDLLVLVLATGPAAAPATAAGAPELTLPILAAAYPSPLWSVAFSPDGNTLATPGHQRDGYENEVRLWDAHTGALIRTFPGHGDYLMAVAFSPDGQTLAYGGGTHQRKGEVFLRDVRTGVVKKHWADLKSYPQGLTFSADGKRLSCAAFQEAVVYDIETEKRQTAVQDKDLVTAAALAPDGKVLVTGNGRNVVKFWDAATGTLQRSLKDHDSWIASVAFAPDGKVVASGSVDATVILWEVETGKRLWQSERHKGEVQGLSFSADGKRLAVAASDGATVWEVSTGRRLHDLEGGKHVRSAALSPGGKFIATGDGQGVARLYDAETGKLRCLLADDTSTLAALACAPDGRTVAVSRHGVDGNTLWLWDARTGKVSRTLSAGTLPLTALAFTPDSKTLVSLAGGGPSRPDARQPVQVQVWDLTKGRSERALASAEGRLTCMALAPDGKTVATGIAPGEAKDGPVGILLWDVAGGKVQRTLKPDGEAPQHLAFSPDGKKLAALHSETLLVLDVETGKQLSSYRPQRREGWLQGCTFTPDGASVAVLVALPTRRSMIEVRRVEAATGKELQTLGRTLDHLSSIAFAPDGKTLAVAGGWGRPGAAVNLWNVETGELARPCEGHTGRADAVAFLDSGTLLSAGSDHTVKVWDPGTGQLRATLALLPSVRPDEPAREWITFTPAGHYESSPRALDFLFWRVGQEVFPSQRYAEKYHDPDRVIKALQGH